MKSDTCKYAPETEKWKKRKLRFIREIWWLVLETEISTLSRRLPDNEGELAYMWLVAIHENNNNK